MIYTTPPAAIAPFLFVREDIETQYATTQKPPVIFFWPDFDVDDATFEIEYYATPDSEGETIASNMSDQQAEDWLIGREDIYGYYVYWVHPNGTILDYWNAHEFLYDTVKA